MYHGSTESLPSIALYICTVSQPYNPAVVEATGEYRSIAAFEMIAMDDWKTENVGALYPEQRRRLGAPVAYFDLHSGKHYSFTDLHARD